MTGSSTEISKADDRFQILSLDGGGSKGIFIAALLAGLENDLQQPVVKHFDLIVGTSTGGIIALGLGAGLSPAQIVDFYLRDVHLVFPGPKGYRTARRLLTSKYDGRGLAAAVKRVIGAKLLGESKVPLVIPAFNIAENKVHLFKTPHHPRFRRDWRLTMAEVAVATSAAPSFFPAHRLSNGGMRLIDGCVWANNPIMVGVTEAVGVFGQDLANIRVFSIGSTANVKTRPRFLDSAGAVGWGLRAPNVVDVMLAAQEAGALAQAQLLVGKGNVLRLDPLNRDEEVQIDGLKPCSLIARAAHFSRTVCPEFEEVFGSHLPPRYLPLQPQEMNAG